MRAGVPRFAVTSRPAMATASGLAVRGRRRAAQACSCRCRSRRRRRRTRSRASAKLTSFTASKSVGGGTGSSRSRSAWSGRRRSSSGSSPSRRAVVGARVRGAAIVAAVAGADAGGDVSGADLDEGRPARAAFGDRTAGSAARSGSPSMALDGAQARHALGQREERRAARRSSLGFGKLQAARVGVRRAPRTLRAPGRIRPAGRHRAPDVVADLRREPQVVGDEHHRGAIALLHLGDQLARCAPGSSRRARWSARRPPRSFGRLANAIAISTRWHMPPES